MQSCFVCFALLVRLRLTILFLIDDYACIWRGGGDNVTDYIYCEALQHSLSKKISLAGIVKEA